MHFNWYILNFEFIISNYIHRLEDYIILYFRFKILLYFQPLNFQYKMFYIAFQK